MEQNSKKGWAWMWVLLVLAAAVVAWLWLSRQAAAPGASETAGPALSADDTTDAIEAELNATDFGNLEAELQSTEADLQSL